MNHDSIAVLPARTSLIDTRIFFWYRYNCIALPPEERISEHAKSGLIRARGRWSSTVRPGLQRKFRTLPDGLKSGRKVKHAEGAENIDFA